MAQQTGFGIQEFYRTAVDRGLARTNLFRIKNIEGIFNSEDTDLLIYAQGGSIPSRSISTAKVSFKTFDFVVPMAASYPENQSWSVTFYCDTDYILRDIFEGWSRKTFDEHKQINTSNLVNMEVVLLDNSSASPTEVPKMAEVRNYKFIGCFPTQVGAMSYSVGNAGDLATMSVTIAFQYIISSKNV
jgi:hypothetical protein